MKSTLTNINASKVLQALRKAKPVSMKGRAAVENYRQWLVSNPLTAISLQASIESMTDINQCYDAGNANVVATLKGLMPQAKLKVAVAYEAAYAYIQNNSIMAPSEEAMQALESLYDYDATKIIDRINSGVLDKFATNPEIAKLISWAKSANRAEPERSELNADDEVSMSMTPVLVLAMNSENDTLIAIDDKVFLQSKQGALTYVPVIDDAPGVNDDVKRIVLILGQMHASASEPNMLMLNDDVLEVIKKSLPIHSFGIDLTGGINELVQMNGTAMSTDKAIALLKNNDDLVASMVLDDTAKDAIQVISTIMQMFEKYRGSIAGSIYANKYTVGSTSFYIVPKDNAYGTFVVMNDSVVDTALYNNVYDILHNETVTASPALFGAISKTYASQLKNESSKLSVKRQIVEQLTSERKQYEELLSNIKKEQDDMAEVTDVNEDKVKQLDSLRTKVEQKISEVADEISQLTK
jgi:hypothetical protein